MFFILSKTISYIFKPLFLTVAVLVSSWFVRNEKWKRKLFLLGLCMLLLFTNEFITNELTRLWEFQPTSFNEIREYEYGILLCGAAGTDLGPADRVYIRSAADRINHTVQLYKMGRIRKILVSGGSGRLLRPEDNEAKELAGLMVMMGVPAGDILQEGKSRNTHESAVEVKNMLDTLTTADRTLLITSGYHMRRASACFAKAGWPCDHFSVDPQSHRRQFTPDVLFIPKNEPLNQWSMLWKEWLGMVAYWIAGYI